MFPYVESHNFYVEHWYHTIFWNKVREFGALLERHRFLADAEDIFYLQRHEVADAFVDLRLAWAAGSEGRGVGYWPPIVERRKQVMAAMRAFTPPPALGSVPEAITEPMTIMLWGITTERVHAWAAGDGDGGDTLSGFAGSPGTAEGTARVILEVDQPRRTRAGRDPGRAGHLAELDAGVRQDRRRRLGHRRDHVPRRDRVARVPPAGGRRHR